MGAGRERWVPIYHEKSYAGESENLARKQFPLTLAWSLTHWKAQGMTLRKVRILLGDRVARSLGVGYVSNTRVKHPWDLIYEKDLPDYEVFQSAKHTKGFRSRLRFELRLEAKASETILNYAAGVKDVQVFCPGDTWEQAEARRALELIEKLRNEKNMRVSSMRDTGRPTDEDAWLWGKAEPDLLVELQQAAKHLARHRRLTWFEVIATSDDKMSRGGRVHC